MVNYFFSILLLIELCFFPPIYSSESPSEYICENSINKKTKSKSKSKKPKPLKPKIVEGIDENATKYYLSICAVFQDEAIYLTEWIEYHRVVGVQHFYLYNNNSHDNYMDYLKPYLAQGIVDLIQWPTPEEQNLTDTQYAVYNHCISICTGQTKWLGIIDIDEFAIPVDRKNLIEFLQDFDADVRIGGIMMNWQMFGTAGVANIPKDKLMIECLTKKAPWNWDENRLVKSICKPHKVASYAVHGGHYKAGYYDIATNGGGGPNQPIQINRIRLNHYWTKDENFFLGIKIPRKEKWFGRKLRPEEIQQYLDSYNQVYDYEIFRFVPEVRRRIFGY